MFDRNRLAMVLILMCLSVACGSTEPERLVDAGDGALSSLPPSDAGTAPPDAGCSLGATRSCRCGAGVQGTQLCRTTGWDNCACATNVADKGSLCVPGIYRAHYTGTYRSEAGGLCGIAASEAQDVGGPFLVEFNREGGQEFAEVTAGCVHTPGDEVPKQDKASYGNRARLTGKVDCSTGEFVGEWEGTYISVGVCDLGTVWTRYFQRGTLTATFDPVRKAFVHGSWDLHERMQQLDPQAGGTGTWEAVLDTDAGVPVSDDECLPVDVPDNLAPIPLGFDPPPG